MEIPEIPRSTSSTRYLSPSTAAICPDANARGAANDDIRTNAQPFFEVLNRATNLELVRRNGLAVPLAQKLFGGSKGIRVEFGDKAQGQPRLRSTCSTAAKRTW